MKVVYKPAKRRRMALMCELVLSSLGAIGGAILVILGIYFLKESHYDTILWLSITTMALLTVAMVLNLTKTRDILLHGIAIDETGVSVFGFHIPWIDVIELYSNPALHYISIVLARPVGILRRSTVYVQKKSISDLNDFFASVRRHGIVVRQEDHA